MAQVVNTDTRLGRRAAMQRVWLITLYVVGLVLAVNLLRGALAELGGLEHLRASGIVHATTAAAHRVFNFPKGHFPPPHATRQMILLAIHLLGLLAVSQFISLPLVVLRSYAAQRQVVEELQRLPDEYWVLNDLSIPGPRGSSSEVDHVVVSPYGLWCLEIRADVGTIVGGEYDYEWHRLKHPGAAPGHGSAFFNPVRLNTTHCAHLGDFLDEQRLKAPVRSMIAFTSAEVPTLTMTPVERLGNVVQSMLRVDTEPVLDDRKVEQIVGTLSNQLATRRRASATETPSEPASSLAAPEARSG